MTKANPFIPCTRFIDKMVRLTNGERVVLAEHQRAILDHVLTPTDGRLAYLTVLWSEVKKSGKTFIAACVGSWILNTWGPRAEVLCAGNDLEQSVARLFSEITRIQQDHPALRRRIVKANDKILLLDDDSKALPVAMDEKGEAGGEPSITIHDEAWGITSEQARRLFDELTPPPTRPMALRWISSYAGFPGESLTLEGLWTRGLAGTPIAGLPDCTANESLFAFMSHTPRMPWQLGRAGERYYSAQRTELRPSAFLRLHENQWVTGESVFVTPEMWDACFVPSLRPPLSNPEIALFAGVDAAAKHDTAAVVSVYWKDEALALGPFRIWRPSPTSPLDIEATIEAYLRDLDAQYRLVSVLADPWQMHRSVTTLQAAGMRIEGFAQTVPNQTRAGQGLFDLLKGRNLQIYADDELRQQALNAVAVESSRGWRLAKEKASKKIDAVVALSMACVAALDGRSKTVELRFLGGDAIAQTVDQIQREAAEDYRRRGEESAEDILRVCRTTGYWGFRD